MLSAGEEEEGDEGESDGEEDEEQEEELLEERRAPKEPPSTSAPAPIPRNKPQPQDAKAQAEPVSAAAAVLPAAAAPPAAKPAAAAAPAAARGAGKGPHLDGPLDLPYTIPLPATYPEFEAIVRGRPAAQLATAIQRIRTFNAVALATDSKRKMQARAAGGGRVRGVSGERKGRGGGTEGGRRRGSFACSRSARPCSTLMGGVAGHQYGCECQQAACMGMQDGKPE